MRLLTCNNSFSQIYYESALETGEADKKKGDDGELEQQEGEKPPYEGYNEYERVCRGEQTPPHHITARLKCRYDIISYSDTLL